MNNPPTRAPPSDQPVTSVLFENTDHEDTIYLGPWEVIGSEPRRVRWQCAYQGDVLEHYCTYAAWSPSTVLLTPVQVPSNSPLDIFPHTLHGRHRPYDDPRDMELKVTFEGQHRIRYVTANGVVVHDDHIDVKYEFSSCTSSHDFQGDLRHQDLVDHFDVDVIWSDRDARHDAFGTIKGIGSIQRLKLWRDRYSTYHHLTFLANKTENRYREYLVCSFNRDFQSTDDHGRRVRLTAQGRRGSAGDGGGGDGGAGSGGGGGGSSGRRFSMSAFRPRRRTSGHRGRQQPGNASRSTTASATPGPLLDIRYLGIQFTRVEGKCVLIPECSGHRSYAYTGPPDYQRFKDQWITASDSDGQFQGVPFPTDRYELAGAAGAAELDGAPAFQVLYPVQEPLEMDEYAEARR